MKKLIYLLISLPFVFYACSEDTEDPIFDLSPEERVELRISEYADVLESAENGWKVVYFPNDEVYGGFSFVFDFNKEEQTVEMFSDLIETGSSESTYSYRWQQEPSLVFDTFGLLHELSDPANGTVGEGYQGEFEFYFRELSADKVVLEGKLHGREMILTKATAEDVSLLTQKYQQLALIYGDPNQSVFRNIEIDGVPIAAFDYSSFSRMATVTYTDDADGTESLITTLAAVAPTSDGFEFSTPLEIADNTIVGFTYNEENANFTDEATGATLQYSDVPATPLAPYNYGTKFGSCVNFDEQSKSSVAWNNFYYPYLEQLTAMGLEITYTYILDLNTEAPYVYIITNLGKVWYDINYDVKEDGKVYFALTGATNAGEFAPYFEPILNILIGSEKGYYLRETGGLLNYTNGTFSLINADNPAYEINFYDF